MTPVAGRCRFWCSQLNLTKREAGGLWRINSKRGCDFTRKMGRKYKEFGRRIIVVEQDRQEHIMKEEERIYLRHVHFAKSDVGKSLS